MKYLLLLILLKELVVLKFRALLNNLSFYHNQKRFPRQRKFFSCCKYINLKIKGARNNTSSSELVFTECLLHEEHSSGFAEFAGFYGVEVDTGGNLIAVHVSRIPNN